MKAGAHQARRFAASERSQDKRLTNRLRAWGPAAAWATVLFLLSAWPNPTFPEWLRENDKLAHAGLYSILGATLGYARYVDTSPLPHVVLLALGGLYGATDEWHQAFVYGRTPGWGDWIADITGVCIGYFMALFFLSRIMRTAATTAPSTNVPD